MGPITEELAGFLEGPNSIALATQDGALAPECARALALRCAGDGHRLTLWLPTSLGVRTRANLGRDDRIAIAVSHPSSHRTLQLKGRALRVSDADDQVRPAVDAYFEAVTEEAARVGLPRRLLDRVLRWPLLEIELRVEELFDQSPGPGAGGRLVPAAGPGSP